MKEKTKNVLSSFGSFLFLLLAFFASVKFSFPVICPILLGICTLIFLGLFLYEFVTMIIDKFKK